MRILIVDDDKSEQVRLRAALEKVGHEIMAAGNAQDAMEILQSGWSRLVIADWEMPKTNGLELCRLIREADFGGYVYIILVTSRNQEDDVVKGIEAGADDFLATPFGFAELCVRVRAGERLLLIETRDVAIFAMAKLMESRDPETGAHLDRMRYYSRILTRELARAGNHKDEIDAEYVHLIFLTSPLHDIGKVGIPDHILMKVGRYDDGDFEIMKQHTVIGAAMLDGALQQFPGVKFLQMARDIASTHHEQFDGSGYTFGLAGNAIPLCGRIVALADVYDAMTSRRLYKEAFTHELAKAIIFEERGKQFDPRIVDAFARTEAQFIAVRESFSDRAVKLPPRAVVKPSIRNPLPANISRLAIHRREQYARDQIVKARQ